MKYRLKMGKVKLRPNDSIVLKNFPANIYLLRSQQ